MADLFDGIETTKVGNKGGTPLSEGEFLLKITDVQYLKTQLRGDAFIVEYEVVESTSAKDPVGSKRSWYQSMAKRPIALEKIKEFMLAMLGYEPKRDEARIVVEVDPNLKSWTNAACENKALNDQKVRATVRKKAPSVQAKLQAQAAGKAEPTGFDNVRFSPLLPSAPPVRTN